MDNQEIQIINIICHKLPYKIANAVFHEFEDRNREVKRILEYPLYNHLKDVTSTIEMLLAITIFYKRVLSNIDGVEKFYNRVTSISNTNVVAIGEYKLTKDENDRINAMTISFFKVCSRYNVHQNLFDYTETLEFVRKIRDYYLLLNSDHDEE